MPSANAMSPAEASRRCAAIVLPLSMIFIAARSSAEPPTAIEREPNVPEPYGTWSVSPSMISMLAIGTPSRDEMIWAKVVAWPWP